MQKKYIMMETAISLTGLSRATIYTEIYKAKILGKGIPFHKFGPRQLRFCEDELLDWMESRYQTYRSVKEAVEINKRKAAIDAVQ
jgi:predicted DNA-binding transcriptional regulator AlpA